VPADPELLSILARMFPSFRGLPPEEAERRAEAMGLFAAACCAAGPDALAQRGVPFPPAALQALAPVSPRVVQARSGGSTFLVHARRAIDADAIFAQMMTALARAYADSIRPGGTPPPALPPAAPAQPARMAPPGFPGGAPAPARLDVAIPRTPTREMQNFEALLGESGDAPAPAARAPAPAARPSSGGLDLDLAPEGAGFAAPAPRPAPKAPPRASASPGAGGGLDLDLAPEDASPGAFARPAPAPAPKPAPRPAAPGGLDLLPDEPEPPPPAADVAEFDPMASDGDGAPAAGAYEDPRFAAAAAAPPPRGGGGGGGGGKGTGKSSLYPEAPAGNKHQLDMGELEEQEASAPDPATAALRRFERSGDPGALAEAEQHLRKELQAAPHPVAWAAAAAGLARIELLRGKAADSEKMARAALQRDPSNPFAVEVLVRLARGEADQAAYLALLAQLRAAVDMREPERIAAVAGRMEKQFPGEVHPALARFFAAKLVDDGAAADAALSDAWSRWPSERCVAAAFGGMVDADVSDQLIAYGREGFKDKDGARLKQTVEDVDSKENLVAGSLRLGVALARVALAKQVPKAVEKRLTFGVGRGLIGLQYYDAAQPWIGRAGCLGPTPEESKAMNNERVNASALRRAFDRPGIKAQLKAYPCLGVKAMSDMLRTRLETIRKDKEQKQQELLTRGAELAAKAASDAALRAEVGNAAQAASAPDPFGPLAAAEKELAQIAAEREAAKQPEKKADAGGGGLFGKLKAAATQVASSAAGAAKDLQLNLKETQAKARRDQAARSLAQGITKTLSDVQWRHPLLKAFAQQAATVEAFIDYYEAEEARGKKELDALAESVV
jgi:hypothetical protein